MLSEPCKQPVVKIPLHSTGAASRLPAFLLGHILPVFSLRRALYWPSAASITTGLGATLGCHHGLLEARQHTVTVTKLLHIEP